jgi:hypothetical protein
MEERCE